MKLLEATPKRMKASGNFFLNVTVASVAVAAFEVVWRGILPAFLQSLVFPHHKGEVEWATG